MNPSNRKSFAIGAPVEVIADCALKGVRGTINTAKVCGSVCIYTLKTTTGLCGHFYFKDLTAA